MWPRIPGLLFALVSYFATPRLLRLFESAHLREKRLGIDREIPLLAELLSAHLSSGASLLESLQSVARALDSQLRQLTDEVGERLRLGQSDPFAPWRSVSALEPLADTCNRAHRSGASMASAAARFAERMRAREFRHRQSELERAVVRMTLPMGLCLLPAFVATVVIPMAYALFQGVDF